MEKIYKTPERLRDQVKARVRRLGREGQLRRMLSAARHRAAKKNIEFSLTLEDLRALWPSDEKCPVFGTLFGPAVRDSTKQGPRRDSASLDRIDSCVGYTRANCAIISNHANYRKGRATLTDLVVIGKWAERQIAFRQML